MKRVVCQRRMENVAMSEQAVKAVDPVKAETVLFTDEAEEVLDLAKKGEPLFVVAGQSQWTMYGTELAERLKMINPESKF